MKKNIRNILIIITILILILIGIMSKNISVQAVDNGNIELNILTDDIDQTRNVDVQVILKEQKQVISSFTAYFHYDTNIFEEIRNDNITTSVSEDKVDTIVYSNTTNKITIYYVEDIENINKICTIKLKLKENDNINNIKSFVTSLGKVETYTEETENLTDYDTISKTTELNKQPDPTPNPTPEALYLSSEIYKIGNNDIKKYEVGDKYISRVIEKTTLEKYIANLKTNGTIKVLKTDGTELQKGEYVGTGMTLQVTKDKEKIELQIAVMGDLDGNGKVTITDLSVLNQTLLQTTTLENEYKIAADLDENNNITVTDLSTINKMLLGIL